VLLLLLTLLMLLLLLLLLLLLQPSPFGAPAGTSGFGASQPAFGASSAPAFGAQQSQGGLFGGSAFGVSTGSHYSSCQSHYKCWLVVLCPAMQLGVFCFVSKSVGWGMLGAVLGGWFWGS
jgi:hypothetical protein